MAGNPVSAACSAAFEGGPWDIRRDYFEYHLLGGTGRTSEHVGDTPPIVPIRDWPEDASADASSVAPEYGRDAVFPSWCTAAELCAVDWAGPFPCTAAFSYVDDRPWHDAPPGTLAVRQAVMVTPDNVPWPDFQSAAIRWWDEERRHGSTRFTWEGRRMEVASVEPRQWSGFRGVPVTGRLFDYASQLGRLTLQMARLSPHTPDDVRCVYFFSQMPGDPRSLGGRSA